MTNPWTRVRDYFLKDLWKTDRSSLAGTRRIFTDAARMLVVVGRDVLYGQLTLWAMGLVYTTLMSLVPLLAVAFSVLKAFGVQNKLEPFLLDMVAPLGANGPVIVHRIVEFVNNMRVGVLGIVGLGLLMYTVMSLIQKVEQAFNTIWKVRGQRTVLRQFTEYLSVVLAGPVLVVSALALTASLMSSSLVKALLRIESLAFLVSAVGSLLPYVLVCVSFTLLYVFLPNTKVRWSAAVVGGFFGGVLWQSVGWGFASFIVASTRYAAIYSSFAILILFMTWLYLSWLILLIGCEVSFYYQNPQLLSMKPVDGLPDAQLLEKAAVSIMFLIGSHFYRNLPAWTTDSLSQRLGIESDTIGVILAALKKKHLITETADDAPAFVPARDLDAILLRDIYSVVRPGADEVGIRREIARLHPVDTIAREIDVAIGTALGSRSLGEMVRSEAESMKKAA